MPNPGLLKLGMLYCETDSRHKITKPLSAILTAMEEQPQLDILLAPEWFFVSPNPQEFYSPTEYRDIVSQLEQATEGLEMLLIPGSIARRDRKGKYLNTAPVISNGKTILEYSKKNNGGDCEFANRHGTDWKKGKNKGIFRWRDYCLGIEICADHSSGSLRKKDKQRDLDMQIVVSCGMSLWESSLSIHDNGLAFLCDGNTPKHDIRRGSTEQREARALKRPKNYKLGDDISLKLYHMQPPEAVSEAVPFTFVQKLRQRILND